VHVPQNVRAHDCVLHKKPLGRLLEHELMSDKFPPVLDRILVDHVTTSGFLTISWKSRPANLGLWPSGKETLRYDKYKATLVPPIPDFSLARGSPTTFLDRPHYVWAAKLV
jgi:hypothetical protein